MTNVCVYDCQYCVNRRSNDVPRAAFTPRELCRAHHAASTAATTSRGCFSPPPCCGQPGLHHRADDRDPAPAPAGVRASAAISTPRPSPGPTPCSPGGWACWPTGSSVNIELPSAPKAWPCWPRTRRRTAILAPMGQIRDGIARLQAGAGQSTATPPDSPRRASPPR